MASTRPTCCWRALLFTTLWICASPHSGTSALRSDPLLRSAPFGDATAGVDADVLVITPKTDLKTLFACSQLHPIGYYNEYFVTCALREQPPPWKRIQLQGVRLHGVDLYDDAASVHVELDLTLNVSASAATSIELNNSVVLLSAVRLEASTVSLDKNSSLNTTACGLKFGPGYNSWFNMGSSYGGVGGAALAGMLHRHKCEDLQANTFFRAIGSVAGDVGNFQGYGSGGGNDAGRGGGRIEIRALDKLVFNGSLVANGGAAAGDSFDSAGSGGTVLIKAGHVSGLGIIQANGGEPSAYDDSKGAGGGGGGGGGRIALSFKKLDELNATQLQAYGGGTLKTTVGQAVESIQWCQLGADGSILKTQVGDADDGEYLSSQGLDNAALPLVGSLVIKGRRVDHGVPAKPITLYGCTPLYYETTRGELFVPDYVAQLFVTGGATLCVNYLVLQPIVSTTNSSIVIEPGSTVDMLDRSNRTVSLGATHVSLQSYVGPASQVMRDAFFFALSGSEVALANAQLLVDRVAVNAVASLVIDKFSVVKFRRFALLATSAGDIQVFGFLQPSGEDNHFEETRDSEVPVVHATATQSIAFKPQAAQIGALSIELHAGQDAEVDLPFETPFLEFFAEATNLVVARVSGGAIRECKVVDSLASSATCASLKNGFPLREEAPPFLVSFKATATLTLGNVTAGSILACSDGVLSVEGRVTSDGLGCAANTGPGTSEVVNGASGGAGHGGKGGNVEPGNTGGGKAYDGPPSHLATADGPPAWPVWPGSGAAAGDGSSGIEGGSGGGIVYIGARQLAFSNAAAIVSARGAIGTKNGGGGAGGAIGVFVGEVVGSGVVDVSGGDSLGAAVLLDRGINGSLVWEPSWPFVGAKTGGGGGGGGIVRTLFRGDQPGTAGNGDAFITSGGKVVFGGGKGTGGENGGAGIFTAVNCSIGRGGGLCGLCEPGAFSPGDQPHCLPCEPGSYADKFGVGSCSKCAKGYFNHDFGQKKCEACAPGTSATKPGATECGPCAPGSFADKPGSPACLLCPKGTISIMSGATNCTVCGIGETTAMPGSLHCTPCRTKPDHSVYNVRGKCTYACEKGRNGLDCLTPFERFVKPIGGPLGFAILVLSLISVVVGSWAFLTFRTSADQKFKQRFAQYKAQTQRDEQSLVNLTKNLTPRLTDHDLTNHVTRLYFSGDNHLFSAWVLDPFGMPPELKELVRDDDGFATFATSCNELVAWPESGGWECWTHRVLLVLAPPFATLFLRKRQLHRVEKLALHVTQYTGGFVRELGFRRHGAQLKVGFSPDFSLAYFDVIAPTTASGLTASAAATPSLARSRLPEKDAAHKIVPPSAMTIAVAGSGSFFRPYHVDTNDALVRAVPARLELLQHQFWIDFVAEMNQRLRLVQQPSASHPRRERIAVRLQSILEFVAAFNKKRTDNADGMRVQFGTLESCAQFTEFDTSAVLARLEAFPLEPFKFALLVTKPVVPALSTKLEPQPASGQEFPADLHLSSVDAPLDTEDPRPFEFRYSSIRMEALFDQPSPAGSDDPQQPLHLTKQRRRRSSQDASATTTVSDLLLCAPHSATFHWLAAALRPLTPVFRLRNLRPRAIRTCPFVLPLLMLLLLLGDCIAIFWVLMEFYCVQVDDPTTHDSGCSRVAFVFVLSLLPLAVPGAPLLGLISLTRRSVFYGKLFAVWTLGSIVNLVVTFVCGLVYLNYVRESVLLVVAAWFVLKVLEKELVLQCIAQYTVERPLKGWRGLHTTKDWYDAAYTPLIHHER